jgi:hypothetical protein
MYFERRARLLSAVPSLFLDAGVLSPVTATVFEAGESCLFVDAKRPLTGPPMPGNSELVICLLLLCITEAASCP